MKGNEINGELVNEKMLLNKGYRKYRGKEVDVFFNRELCTHSGNCIRGNHEVFDVGRKPWIMADHASAAEDMAVIDTCPSGALKYIHKEKFQFEKTASSFVALQDEKIAGEITWSNAGENLLIIDHTFVDPIYRGYGLAGRLVLSVVEMARLEQKKVLPLCPFAKKEFERHKDYKDVLKSV